MAGVLVILGSSSDKPVYEKAKKVLDELKISVKVHVASAHRTPKKVEKIVLSTDADVIITIAGLSAALPGVVASLTIKPVIGVPVEAKLGGLDALLSIAQMPPGIPVACVGVGNADNAALLAAQIIALKDSSLAKKLSEYRQKMVEKVESDDKLAQNW